MKNTIFQNEDYKIYLKGWVKSQPAGGHGVRGQMAKAIHCQTAFISQVLNGNSHLSLEQADKLNGFLGHSKEESAFFLLLVQYTRAGTESLRQHFQEQIREITEKRSVLKERLQATHELSKEDHSIYFSSWAYAAVMVLASMPGFETKTAIIKALRLPQEKAGNILEFLVSRGLLTQNGDRYGAGKMQLHLANDSSMIVKHHTNWRIKCLETLDQEQKTELHYSSVVTLSREDITKVKLLLADALANARKIIEPSPSEELYSLCMDFFQVNRG